MKRGSDMIMGNEKPFTWDYDYKDLLRDGFVEGFDANRVRDAFHAAKKDERAYRDAVSKLLAYKFLAQTENPERDGESFLHHVEHEDAQPAKDVLSAALPEGWGYAGDDDVVQGEGMALPVRRDALNSFATTLNYALPYLYPSRFGLAGEGGGRPSFRKALALYEEKGAWPDIEDADGSLGELRALLERFARLAHTVGNFAFIPFMRFGRGDTFNTRRGTGCLPGMDEPVRDYWDMSLEWLGKRGIPRYWTGLPADCPVTFEKYVALSRLEFYCVDDEVVRAFLRTSREEGASAQDILDAYERLRGKAVWAGFKVEPFWAGHTLEDPRSAAPKSVEQLISFLEAVNLRIEARGRTLIALRQREESCGERGSHIAM